MVELFDLISRVLFVFNAQKWLFCKLAGAGLWNDDDVETDSCKGRQLINRQFLSVTQLFSQDIVVKLCLLSHTLMPLGVLEEFQLADVFTQVNVPVRSQ